MVLLALAITLVRALVAFRDLHESRGIPLGQIFYVPVALVAALGLTARWIWQTARRLLEGWGGIRGRGEP